MLLRRVWLAIPILGLGLVVSPGVTRAENVEQKLSGYEAEVRQLGTDLPQLNKPAATSPRRLVDALVAFRLGQYDTAAFGLAELIRAKGALSAAEHEQATFYLAETLYQRGDRGASRIHYTQVVDLNNSGGPYYQQALLRLVEIAILQKDDASETLAAIDRLPPGARSPLVPYIRGKFAFANGKHDEALTYFNDVPKGSAHELQALYYVGATSIAKKDLQKANEVYTDLLTRRPRSAADRRVVELAQLALGRLYYERDQFSKSIDSYLLVDRRSDLFPDALYEVAWVYVKNKQYDKALRALELLAQSDPHSMKTPTVRLLEANLRIRKAQMLRDAEITGTSGTNTESPATQYDKASAVFAEVHDAYYPAYQSLAAMVDGKGDPTQYIMQIAGRTKLYDATLPIPDAAAQWLRDEPAVQRFIEVETDLGQVETNIEDTEVLVARLEAVLATTDKLGGFPALARRRSRIGQIQDDLIAVRSGLADQALRHLDSNGELSNLSATRKTLVAQYLALGSPEKTYADRVALVHQEYAKLDAEAGEAAREIEAAQAVSIAVRKHMNDAKPGAIEDAERATLTAELEAIATESKSMAAELEGIHRELALGRDLAGAADEAIAAARILRKQVQTALDSEHRSLAGFASSSRNANESKTLATFGDRGLRVSGALDQLEAEIDRIADQNIVEAKATITFARESLVAFRAELAEHEAESHALGATLLADSFKAVKAKFYDVVIRSDVGTVDVSWAQKSDTDDDLKRFNLNRSREMKQLKDEFKDILEASVPKPSAPRKVEPMPTPGDAGASPDKGGASARVKPIESKSGDPALPTVKPDPKKPAPKGGSR